MQKLSYLYLAASLVCLAHEGVRGNTDSYVQSYQSAKRDLDNLYKEKRKIERELATIERREGETPEAFESRLGVVKARFNKVLQDIKNANDALAATSSIQEDRTSGDSQRYFGQTGAHVKEREIVHAKNQADAAMVVLYQLSKEEAGRTAAQHNDEYNPVWIFGRRW